jgi:hypothetical protein
MVGDGIVSIGWSNSTLRVSATQSNQAFSAAGGASNFQTLSFADTNSVSFTNTNGSIGVASVKLQMFAVSNTTQSSSGTANHTALSFGGAGAVSVGITGGSVVVSAPNTIAQTNQTLSWAITSNTTGNTSGMSVDARSLTLRGDGNISVGISTSAGGSSLIISGSQSAQTQSVIQGIIVSNTTYRTGDVSFSNLNGISFGSNGANVITASYTVPVAGAAITISDAATSGTIGRLAFTNLNGVTLSMSTGAAGSHTIVGSHNAITSQTNQTGAIYVTAQSTGQSSSSTYDLRTLSFIPDGIISAGWSGGSFRISATQSVQTQSNVQGIIVSTGSRSDRMELT